MTVSRVSISDVKEYMPAHVTNDVPVVCQTTLTMCQKIRALPVGETSKWCGTMKVRTLDSYVSELKETKKVFEEGNKNEKLHKILSLVSLAAWVAAVAVVIGLAVATIIPAPAAYATLIGLVCANAITF